MELEIVPFDRRFVEAAAALLAAGHASAGEDAPVTDLADPDAARARLTARSAAGPAVVAVDADGTVVGFMAATLADFPGNSRARVRMQDHAVGPTDARLTYRRLYQELAGRLAGIGCFEHTVVVAARHRGTFSCFGELGFGIDQILGVRPVAPIDGAARQVRLRQADPDDLAHLLDLTVELQHFHAQAPILLPALPGYEAIRDDLLAAIADDHRLVLLAEVGGRPVGLMVAHPDSHFTGTARIGIAVVTASARATGVGTTLLSEVVDWAARLGFRACGAEWSSANLVSDAFWRGHGFVPVRYQLTRRIDPRVAWADSRLSYRDFLPTPEQAGSRA